MCERNLTDIYLVPRCYKKTFKNALFKNVQVIK